MSSQSGPGERAASLNIRRPVELPQADIEEAGDLAPAAAAPPHEDDRSAAEEKAADKTRKQPPDTPPEANKQNDPATDVVVAADIATPDAPRNGATNADEMPPDRPKKPVLAAVAIGGTVLLAVPILLIGTGSHHARKHPLSTAADRVLPGDGRQPPPGMYTSTSPSPAPTSTPTPSPHATHKPKATKSAAPKPSGKPPAHARAARKGVPASEKPEKGGNPWALEVHAPYDLNPGKTLRTNRIALTMQTGGNLVLRDTSSKIIWSTRTRHAGAYAEFQADGNLVVYINGRQPIWASQTPGHSGATLVLQADDNMVIYNGHDPIWATNT